MKTNTNQFFIPIFGAVLILLLISCQKTGQHGADTSTIPTNDHVASSEYEISIDAENSSSWNEETEEESLRELSTINLANASQNVFAYESKEGDNFLGLTISYINVKQKLVESSNEWVDTDKFVMFSGEMVIVGDYIYSSQGPSSIIIHPEYCDMLPDFIETELGSINTLIDAENKQLREIGETYIQKEVPDLMPRFEIKLKMDNIRLADRVQ